MGHVALVTGVGGLVGSETARLLHKEGFHVVGVDNNMRAKFFGPEASTAGEIGKLKADLTNFEAHHIDIRDEFKMGMLFKRFSHDLDLIVHTAAQPSHDWAARNPRCDFLVNANGTLNLLELTRKYPGDRATFAHISTSKVYGDNPNRLPLQEVGMRLDLPEDHPYYEGIKTDFSIDNCLHSLFGVSKAAGDLLVQEYGRYFDTPTVCFRPGCVTGPAHAGVELHGFLAYLMKCTVTGRPYTVYGYDGKQVRCNIYAEDLAAACLEFHREPFAGAVYNIGGGRLSACSMIEAIALAEKISGEKLEFTYDPTNRIGDHRWWISDISEFQADYSDWFPLLTPEDLLRDIYENNAEEWLADGGAV